MTTPDRCFVAIRPLCGLALLLSLTLPVWGQTAACPTGTARVSLENSQHRLHLGNVSGMPGFSGQEILDGTSARWYSSLSLWAAGKVAGSDREAYDIWSPRHFIPGPYRATTDCSAYDTITTEGQTAQWTVHDGRAPSPLGLDADVRVELLPDAGALGRAAVWTYTITYQGDAVVDSFFIGIFADIGMGNDFFDEATGTDTLRAMGYVYPKVAAGRNGETSKTARGLSLLEARAGEVSRPVYAMMTYSGDDPGIGASPDDPGDLFRMLTGIYEDGQPLREGGEGHPTSSSTPPDAPQTRYSLTGDPVQQAFWSALNIDGTGQVYGGVVRPFSLSAGPFRLFPSDVLTFSYALVWSRGADHLDAITQLRADVDEVRSFLGFPTVTAVPPEAPLADWHVSPPFPNPAQDQVTFTLESPSDGVVTVYDLLGREVAQHVLDRRSDRVDWSTAGWAPGLYLARFVTPHAQATRLISVAR